MGYDKVKGTTAKIEIHELPAANYSTEIVESSRLRLVINHDTWLVSLERHTLDAADEDCWLKITSDVSLKSSYMPDVSTLSALIAALAQNLLCRNIVVKE